jgi:hypothetical protein
MRVPRFAQNRLTRSSVFGDRAQHVEPGAVPGARITVPEVAAILRRHHRKGTGDEERHRAECVGPPARADLRRVADGGGERLPGAYIEEQRAGELDRGRPPVVAVGLARPAPRWPATAEAQLDEPRGGEEERADEERHADDHGAGPLRVERHCADEEEHGADCEAPRLPSQPEATASGGGGSRGPRPARRPRGLGHLPP